jgi:hypothetical protein
MEQFLRKYVKNDLGRHIKKKLIEGNFEIHIKINGWMFIRIYMKQSMKVWLLYFFIHHWENYIRSLNTNPNNLLRYDENFVAGFYPDLEVPLPNYLILSPFPLPEQTGKLVSIRENMIYNSKLIISLFQFSYWVPISYDFIIWSRLINTYKKFRLEHPPK